MQDRDATHNAACLTKFTELLLLNGIISTQQMWAVFNLVGDLFEGAGQAFVAPPLFQNCWLRTGLCVLPQNFASVQLGSRIWLQTGAASMTGSSAALQNFVDTVSRSFLGCSGDCAAGYLVSNDIPPMTPCHRGLRGAGPVEGRAVAGRRGGADRRGAAGIGAA